MNASVRSLNARPTARQPCTFCLWTRRLLGVFIFVFAVAWITLDQVGRLAG